MKYHGIVIADIHVGACDTERLHNEYTELLINHIKEMESLDYLVIAGDFFDRKYYLNDENTKMAYIMLKELVLACKEKGAKVRIVYGTESHECNQYDIFSLLKIYEDVKVIKTVTEEELLPNLHVLYLPEESIYDKSEHYSEYLEKEKYYDYIFGHGVVREVMSEFALKLDDSKKSKRRKPAVFSTGELGYCCKGQTFFGHYHINVNVNDRFFSIGSFTRWCFGEEGVKGYYELSCNPKKEKYEAIHIDNTMAPLYRTISYGYDNKIFQNEDQMIKTLDHMDELIDTGSLDDVRFMFNIPTTIENPEATINYIKERYKFNDHVKVEITHGYIEEKRKQQKEKVDADNDKYGFIYEKTMDLENTYAHFIAIEYDRNIPTDDIQLYMNAPLQEILNKKNKEEE